MKIQISTQISILVCIIFILNRPAYSQDWHWQNPYPSGNRVHSMEFIDSLTIWFGSSAGSVWHSTDCGNSWDIQYTGIPDLYCGPIDFINPNEGWLGGGEDSGKAYLLHTTDGGYYWEVQLVDSNVHRFTSMYFLDDKYGWAGTEGQAQIYYTNDGGNTWNMSNWKPPSHSSKVTSIVFLDSLKGYATGIFMPFVKSEDGGITWQNVDIGDYLGLKVFFLDSLHGWLTSRGTVLRTIDGGDTWIDDLPVIFERNLWDIFFSDTLTGWVTTKEDGMFRTADGGLSWEYLPDFEPRIDWGGMYFFSPQSGWLDFNRTWDGGATLHPQKEGFIVISFEGVDFINSQVGWVVSGDGIIAKTTNGGEEWFIQDNQYDTDFQDVFALDSDHIWAVGWEGKIYNSIDSGESWRINSYSMGTDSRHSAVTFIDSLTGWIVGGNFYVGGWILKTTDGGATWTDITPYSMPRLVDLYFWNADTGFVVAGGGTTGDIGAIYKTTDGGETWLQKSQNNKGLESICFVNDSIGWASGYKLLLKSTDTGESWEILDENLSLTSTHFVDEYFGWACDLLGNIHFTTDGGTTWDKQYSGTKESLYDLDFVDRNTGWIVGHNATILKTTTGGTGIEDKSIESVEDQIEFHTLQNYPNPFNSKTKILLTTQSENRAIVKIFDITGKEVVNLLDERLKPGSYEVIWDGKGSEGGDLPSGIYICKMLIGNTQQFTSKLMLIK